MANSNNARKNSNVVGKIVGPKANQQTRKALYEKIDTTEKATAADKSALRATRKSVSSSVKVISGGKQRTTGGITGAGGANVGGVYKAIGGGSGINWQTK